MWRTCDEAVLSFGGSHLDTSISLNEYTQTCHWSILTLKSSAHGRTRDGRRNYVHFVTAYDIHFIVNNKYYAIKIQEKFESFCIFPEISCIQSNYLQDRIFRYPISTRIIYLSTYNTRCRYSHGFDAVIAVYRKKSSGASSCPNRYNALCSVSCQHGDHSLL